MAKRLYRKLWGLMAENGDTQKDVARVLLVSPQSVCDRMCGRQDWKLDEMYLLLDRYRVPYSQLHKVFPKGGIAYESEAS